MRPGDHGTDPWEGTETERPIDIEALRADDEFIESLMSGEVQRPAGVRTRGDDVDAELRSMLSAWVLEVRPETVTAIEGAARPEPVTAPVGLVPPAATDPETHPFAPVTPLGARAPRKRQPARYARRALVAASLVAVVSSGLALGAYQSEPGGTLWPMSKVLYAEHARSVQAAADVTTGLDRARVALQQGRTEEAADAIRAVRASLDQVAPAQGHDALDQIQQELSVQLATVDPKAAATLDLPPVATATDRAPVLATVPDRARPAPLTDRAAETGSLPSPTAAAVVPGAPSAPAAPAPDPAAVVPSPPAPVAPAAPDPTTGSAGPSAAPADPATVAPVVPATEPPAQPSNPQPSNPQPTDSQPATGTAGDDPGTGVDPGVAGGGAAGGGTTDSGPAVGGTTGSGPAVSGTTDSGPTDSGSAAPASDGAGSPAAVAPTDGAADESTAPSGGGLTGSLLATVTNAASDTASNAEAAATG